MFSIAYGVITGVISFILINGIAWGLHKLTRGRIVPPNMEAAELWIIPPGGIIPAWVQKLRGRYVDPRFEIEQQHDTISMDNASQNHAFHGTSKNELEKE